MKRTATRAANRTKKQHCGSMSIHQFFSRYFNSKVKLVTVDSHRDDRGQYKLMFTCTLFVVQHRRSVYLEAVLNMKVVLKRALKLRRSSQSHSRSQSQVTVSVRTLTVSQTGPLSVLFMMTTQMWIMKMVQQQIILLNRCT